MTRATVIGAGAWGTTYAAVMADAGADVTIWGRNTDVLDGINRGHHSPLLPDIELPETLRGVADIGEALAGADVVAVALPAQKLRDAASDFGSLLPQDAVVASLMKGVENGTNLRMSQVLAQIWELPEERLAVVSGPNLAREIALKQPTATVVASVNEEAAQLVAAASASAYFRPYTNLDVVGVELCGAYKNVIAVAVGITDALGFGHNTTATVITRGLAEITRLGLAIGGKPETFSGLAGTGDLIATCASPLSRNHTLGSMIGKGASLSDALAQTNGTAEGSASSLSVLQLAREYGVDVPICEAVVAMLHEGAPIESIMSALLSRPRKAEGI